MLSQNVRELGFDRVDGVRFDFQAGQWVSLILPLADGEGRRAYSIASPPDGSPGFSTAVTKVEGGPGSTYLHDLKEGDVIRAIGPQGFFTRAHDAANRHPALFVGTGTGITPLRSMILDALLNNDDAPLTLLLGVRFEEDRLYHEELEALASKHSNLRVEYTLSKPPAEWRGRTGYVQTHVEELWRDLESKGHTARPHVYICGLERMVGAVRDLTRKQMGVERKQVHSERYD
jgi:CDP-4-dehydro-6-deoxyglucose reductase, E3